MKKTVALIILFLITNLSLTSCSMRGSRLRLLLWDSYELADDTFDKVVEAVRSKEVAKLTNLFSETVKNEKDLLQTGTSFVNFVKGDIVSFTSSRDGGVGTDRQITYGKRRQDVNASIYLKTTEGKYYIAMKECVLDEFDRDNVGIFSLYIIDSDDWLSEYTFRGDGEWLHGINIIDYPYDGPQ